MSLCFKIINSTLFHRHEFAILSCGERRQRQGTPLDIALYHREYEGSAQMKKKTYSSRALASHEDIRAYYY